MLLDRQPVELLTAGPRDAVHVGSQRAHVLREVFFHEQGVLRAPVVQEAEAGGVEMGFVDGGRAHCGGREVWV